MVTAVSRSETHSFSKANQPVIRLVAGLGVEGDVHQGATVQHRYHVRRDPTAPNLRQVHLIPAELHDQLRRSGFQITPGQMGENITTRGIDLLSLPAGTRLRLGRAAVIEVTGLRSPCRQLDAFRPGLMSAVLDRDAAGRMVPRSGVMAVVLEGGELRPGDSVRVELPPEPHHPLGPV